MINLFEIMAMDTFSIFPQKLNSKIDPVRRIELGEMLDVQNLQTDQLNINNDFSKVFNKLENER